MYREVREILKTYFPICVAEINILIEVFAPIKMKKY